MKALTTDSFLSSPNIVFLYLLDQQDNPVWHLLREPSKIKMGLHSSTIRWSNKTRRITAIDLSLNPKNSQWHACCHSSHLPHEPNLSSLTISTSTRNIAMTVPEVLPSNIEHESTARPDYQLRISFCYFLPLLQPSLLIHFDQLLHSIPDPKTWYVHSRSSL